MRFGWMRPGYDSGDAPRMDAPQRGYVLIAPLVRVLV